MRLLAFDTAMDACTVALAEEGAVVAARQEAMRRGQAEALVPMIDALMAEVGWRPAALDGIGVSIGPGAFTGIRIGIAAARGLGLALDRPVAGIATTAAIAAAQPPAPSPLLIALETKRDDLYVALTGAGVDPAPRALPPGAVAGWLLDRLGRRPEALRLAGDAQTRAGAALDAAGLAWIRGGGPDLPSPQALARLTQETLADWAARGERPPPPSPLYLRPPDATPPRPPASAL
ncbi:MAG: tRNA (adenosine(37)-N6)-threonylcarbamoyltransferase complex dimerization subunit type 1 TsaB [Marivibrio sp.]|uniref:tRNA (adenosine(37)-N6)-threonylcarbamoyltransferase complex dimerization subunit type 1 TsaB n=1 Tax=Marivibrio sp. TaxID=2039719 RepID=UPI0032F069E8